MFLGRQLNNLHDLSLKLLNEDYLCDHEWHGMFHNNALFDYYEWIRKLRAVYKQEEISDCSGAVGQCDASVYLK